MEKLEQKIKDEAKRKLALVKEVGKWPSMLEKLEARAETLREAEFCRKHGINHARFNRLKNGKESSLPSEKFFDKVRAAFKAEGL